VLKRAGEATGGLAGRLCSPFQAAHPSIPLPMRRPPIGAVEHSGECLEPYSPDLPHIPHLGAMRLQSKMKLLTHGEEDIRQGRTFAREAMFARFEIGVSHTRHEASAAGANCVFILSCTCMYINMYHMRTTIELTDDQRAELLRLAAKRKIKGFSQIVQEALDEYMQRQGGREQAIATAITLKGCLGEKEGDELEKRVSLVRELWRCS
jgi:Arc/MetJ family transcription regulator